MNIDRDAILRRIEHWPDDMRKATEQYVAIIRNGQTLSDSCPLCGDALVYVPDFHDIETRGVYCPSCEAYDLRRMEAPHDDAA